ncbi:hypothetical protein MTR67_003436 [Solanum verrucosum]|uniref:Uncharacterized protein n=1 Tax=Solanum verrucosum TaxID=315347 RepID=A0AAF0PSP6_SOLVR|nr:hypothetical protein MTR67_003436 [Solanum verrucosum]
MQNLSGKVAGHDTKEINEENEYDGGDNDFGKPDFYVPESADANEDVSHHAEKVGASSCLCGTVMQLCWHQQDVKASTLSKSFILGRDPVDKIM